jgi:capsular exopolysaccharide synthesis family protein
MSELVIARGRGERPRSSRAEAPPPADPPAPSEARRVTDSSRGVEEHLVSLLAPSSFEAEQYRALRALLEQRRETETLGILAVSSPTAGDGKTLTAINLAGTLAQARAARILLVDADLRRPSIEECLGLSGDGSTGLVEAILDPSANLAGRARYLPLFNLWVLPAGCCMSSPYEVLKSPRLGDLLAEARRRFDYVLIDTPPMVPVPDLRVIQKWVDGILLVVAAHKTPRRLLEEALRMVDPAKLAGLVFNRDDGLRARGYGYYDYARPLKPGDGSREPRAPRRRDVR